MSIIYNGQIVAGVYTEQILNNADTINAGIIKIATQEEVNAGENNTSAVTPLYLSNKQNKLESGDNISIENDIISCDIKPDVSTIIQNEDGTLTNVGQLTKSGTIKINWEGTQAEYNVAYLNGTIQPDWYCYITDDEEFVDYGDIANQSLSNLKAEGEARFAVKANTDLSNLTEGGEARFTVKANADLSNLTEEGLKLIKDNSGSGLEVCDIGMALYVDETKGLRRYINGQIVDINTNTQAFLNRLKEITTLYPSLLCTEDEWQTAKTMSAFGQVGKFVFNYSGDEVVSVRIPRVVNVQGLFDLQNLGLTVNAGLPNITGTHSTVYNSNDRSGCFNHSSYDSGPNAATVGSNLGMLVFDASLSSSVYGNSTTVQQEAIQYPYFIQIATGSETEANIVNTLENVNGFTLLESKYSDKPLYNESWLLSNGQWNAKAVYPTVYEALQVEYNTEIEAGTTVTLPSGVSYTKRVLSVKLSTEEYTDYDFVLNTTEEKFRLPLLDGSEDLIGDKYDDLTVNASGSTYTYTAPANGWLCIRANHTGQAYYNIDNNTSHYEITESTNTNYGNPSGVYPVKKGDIITISYGGVTEWIVFRFIYAKGNGSLYYYVGDIDQNHGIVNMGRIGEQLATLATKTDMLQASGAGMPSNRYIDLTLGASGSTYTAPANGWFFVQKKAGAAYKYISLYCSTTSIFDERQSVDIEAVLSPCIPVKSGDVVKCTYNATGTTERCRFIFAQGEV